MVLPIIPTVRKWSMINAAIEFRVHLVLHNVDEGHFSVLEPCLRPS
jgi:hypothetical protein